MTVQQQVAEQVVNLSDEGADLYLGKTVRKVSELIEKRSRTTAGEKDFSVNAASAGVTRYPPFPTQIRTSGQNTARPPRREN